jgi:hypothetical protein
MFESDKNNIVCAEQSIANHEITPRNRNENQIRLAKDLFEYLCQTVVDLKDVGQRNSIMEYWVEEGFSKLYRELEQDELFKQHRRLQGNIFKITPQDILQYKQDKTLPE